MSLPFAFTSAVRRFAALAVVLILAGPAAMAQAIVVTIDDASFLREAPLLTPLARNQALLDSLARNGVTAALFVSAGLGADRPAGYAMAQAWGKAGHALGNHTMTHPDFDDKKVSLAQYRQEFIDCDKIMATLPGYQKWFRYPYLHEGKGAEKRDGMRTALAEHGYLSAGVDVDTHDWDYDDRLLAALNADSKADVSGIKRDYLAFARKRALALRDKVRAADGTARPQVLLLHHNLLNALWLDDVLGIYKEQGWSFVAPSATILANAGK